LARSSLLGGLLLLLGVGLATYVLPAIWASFLTPILSQIDAGLDTGIRYLVGMAIIAGMIRVLQQGLGDHPPHGVRGGIFLVISLLITSFFLVRAVGLNFEASPVGEVLTAAMVIVCLVISLWLLYSPSLQRLMITLEDQGWFSLTMYKRTQGLRARRYTMAGFLIIAISGVYSLANGPLLADSQKPLTFDLPFTDVDLFVLPNMAYSVPFLLVIVSVWLSWRAVNLPEFADFLIATEAEMNKVSWSTRKRLIQDTIVVLATVFLLTVFLFVVDWFWGTLLSSWPINVLPSGKPVQVDQQGIKVDW
jgi:preprotein translocase SecE subunit